MINISAGVQFPSGGIRIYRLSSTSLERRLGKLVARAHSSHNVLLNTTQFIDNLQRMRLLLKKLGCNQGFRKLPWQQCSALFSSIAQQSTGNGPRHLLSISDLTPKELSILVLNASKYKRLVKSGSSLGENEKALAGQIVAMVFNKRSTRTRISTEGAVAKLGGHPMFLGKDDIQLGV